MRVLLTLYSTSFGGAEGSILQLSKKLSEDREIQVSVLWVYNYSLRRPEFGKEIRVWYIKMAPFWYKLLAPFIVVFICLVDKIELVNLNWRCVYEESLLLGWLGVKSVSTVRAILLDRQNAHEYRKTNAIIGISKAVVEQIKKLGYRGTTYLIYNGIDVRSLKDFDRRKRKRGRFLSMGRLVAWKRTDWSIRAIVRLHQKGYSVKLDIYGEGPERLRLEKLIRGLRAGAYIKVKGFVDRNNLKFTPYGIFLIPSYAEPFGKALVENVIREKVVVGTKYGGIPELLPDYDLLFERDDFEDYVRKIEKAYVCFDKYSKIISSLRRQFEEFYDIGRVACEYKKTYCDILGK